uniref:RNA-directed DNA polymerase n=1 Tax=Trichogramma kaykai TaxID=54128 RepID=A0ABD2WGU9_9HYME
MEVRAILGQQEVVAVLDSAATHNFIQPDSLPPLTKIHKVNFTADLAAKQQEMRVTSIATIQITLQNQEFELDVFVAPDLGRPFILGLTWLREERAVVDLYQDVVHLGKRFRCTVPLIPPQGSTPNLNNHIELENGFPKECQKEVRAMLESHSHILTPTPGRLTRTTSIRHEIRLTNPTPFRLPPYSSVSPTKPQILMVELAEPLIDEIIRHQQHDEKLAQLATHSLQGNSGPYQLEEGALWYEDPQTKSKRLTVPLSSRKRVLFEFHDQIGHPGEDETIRSIASRFHWPGQSNSVREHVKLCHICACGKKAKTSQTDMRPHQPTEPWKTIAVDFMGPYPITARRKRFILVVTDLFSRWTEAFAMTASDKPKLIKLLEEEVFGRWGYPQSILSDNGPQFRSLAWKQACEIWQCRLYTTAIYSPRANPTERRNQEIKKGLRLHLMGEQHNQWDLKLPSVLYDLRCRKNAATGVTPAHLLLGKELSRPGDWKLQLRAPAITERHLRVAQAQLQQAKYQAKYASVAPNKFPIKPGDLVYAKTHPLSNAAERYHAGFEAKWEGPFAVTNQLSEDVFELDKHGNSTKTHRSELRPNSSGTQLAITAPPSSDPIPTTVQSDQTPTTPGSDPIPATPSSDPIPTTAPSDPTPIQSDSDQVLTTSSSDAHPTATPEKEGREKEDDGSAERQHRYNLRRRK